MSQSAIGYSKNCVKTDYTPKSDKSQRSSVDDQGSADSMKGRRMRPFLLSSPAFIFSGMSRTCSQRSFRFSTYRGLPVTDRTPGSAATASELGSILRQTETCSARERVPI